jgi:hypothetical protein
MRGVSMAVALTLTVSSTLIRAQNTHVVIQPPTVQGPIAVTTAVRHPDHGYPYNTTPIDT